MHFILSLSAKDEKKKNFDFFSRFGVLTPWLLGFVLYTYRCLPVLVPSKRSSCRKSPWLLSSSRPRKPRKRPWPSSTIANSMVSPWLLLSKKRHPPPAFATPSAQQPSWPPSPSRRVASCPPSVAVVINFLAFW